MSVEPKRALHSSGFEIDSADDLHFQSRVKTLRLLEGARTALTAVGLLAGITILALSADALAVYRSTHLGRDFLLPLWPDDFNLRPTVALVVGSALVVAANAAGLILGKVKVLRDRSIVVTTATFAAPAVALAAAVAAMAFFYAVDASDAVDTVQSWSCRWRDVAMLTRPHFGTLCRQSRAAVALAVVLVPLEVVVLAVAVYELGVRRRASAAASSSSGAGAAGFSVHRRKAPSRDSSSGPGSGIVTPPERMGI